MRSHLRCVLWANQGDAVPLAMMRSEIIGAAGASSDGIA